MRGTSAGAGPLRRGVLLICAVAAVVLAAATSDASAATERLRIDWSGGPQYENRQEAPWIYAEEYPGGPGGWQHRCSAPASGGPTQCHYGDPEFGYRGNAHFDDTNYRSIAFIDDEVPSTRCFRYDIWHAGSPGSPPYQVTATITDPDGTKRVSTHVLERGEQIQFVNLGTSPPTCTSPRPSPPQANLSVQTADFFPDGEPARGVQVGDPLTLRTTVTNKGPNTATDVRVTDALDDSVQLIEARTDHGRCRTVRVVSCPVGALGVGETATVELDVIPDAKVPKARASAAARPRTKPLPRILKPEDRSLRTRSYVSSDVFDPVDDDNADGDGTRVGSMRVPRPKKLGAAQIREGQGETGNPRAIASRHGVGWGSITNLFPNGDKVILYSGSVTTVMNAQWSWTQQFERNATGFFERRICVGLLRRFSAACRALDAAKLERRARYRWFLANAARNRHCFAGKWDRNGRWHFLEHRIPAWGLRNGESGNYTRCTYAAVYWLHH